jgi:hypothetical protein
MMHVEPFMVHGTVAALFSLSHHNGPGEQDSGETIDFISPHADHELQYHVGALYPFTAHYFGNMLLGGFSAFESDENFGGSTFHAGAEAGYKSDSNWRASLGPQSQTSRSTS